MGWQKASGYHTRSRVEAATYKQVIGDGLRFRKDERRASEVAVAVQALNRTLELDGRSPSASNELRWVGVVASDGLISATTPLGQVAGTGVTYGTHVFFAVLKNGQSGSSSKASSRRANASKARSRQAAPIPTPLPSEQGPLARELAEPGKGSRGGIGFVQPPRLYRLATIEVRRVGGSDAIERPAPEAGF